MFAFRWRAVGRVRDSRQGGGLKFRLRFRAWHKRSGEFSYPAVCRIAFQILESIRQLKGSNPWRKTMATESVSW
jgi:hypothetical protein